MTVLVVIRIVTSLVFATAAVGKLADLPSFRRATSDLGVPSGLSGPVSWMVPLLELAISAGLLAGGLARTAAMVGIGLTLAFTAVLAVNLVQGRRPSCNCFGARADHPIGGRSLVRNAALIAALALTAWPGRPTPGIGTAIADFALGLAGPRTVAVLLVGAVAVEAFIIAQLVLRRPATDPTNQAAVYGLPVGSEAPQFVLPDLAGNALSLDIIAKTGRPVLLAFVDPSCGPCRALLPELADWQSTYHGSLTIVVVSRGSVEENLAEVGDLSLAPVLIQESDEVAVAFAALATPSAVVISEAGRVRGSAAGAHAIRHLVDDVLAAASVPASAQPTLPIGADAPLFSLPSADDGDEISLLDFRRRLTLVVFWSPTCGFCRELAPRLRTWESRLSAATAPQLVVVSAGAPTPADTPFLRVGLDSGDLLRRAYGVHGTPMAVLIDAHGRVASEVVVGADATMALAHRAESMTAIADRLAHRSLRIPVVADQA